ncbi:MAG: carbamoyltransferase [Chromatiales bacterium]|jgi:carbamoyltransferase|nr:carbamoyltransferase [Chromatiales bacterium]MDH3893953.1 carbamoyltransferase [Chromatiales bacterium]
MTAILGLSAYYHDSAAALVVDGDIRAAAQEERFSRLRHDAAFPRSAVRYCLERGGFTLDQLDAVVFYDKPWIKFERLLESYLAKAPRGFASFVAAMPVWLKEKLFLKSVLREELSKVSGAAAVPQLLFTEHHQAHAASAFYPSPFSSAAVLCMDGVGEWATTSSWHGNGESLQGLWEIHWPHSLGLLYSAFTYYAGFRVNSGEYKLMGLAPYGEPRFARLIRDELIDIKPDGSFRLNLDYFDYVTGLRMTNQRFDALFGAPPRRPETTMTQHYMDMAASVQAVTEETVSRLATTLHTETGENELCLAGGVALNCVANGRLARDRVFDSIWIQPAAGDAGGALGAALTAWHLYFSGARTIRQPDAMSGALLGPAYDGDAIETCLRAEDACFERLEETVLIDRVAALLVSGAVVGWFQGAMEFGPRALGARSILGDPRDPDMQSRINLKIKYRESFRPFAPVVLEERAADYFALDGRSPYMLVVAPVADAIRIDAPDTGKGLDRLQLPRSTLPAVTHVDYSARVQTAGSNAEPRIRALLEAFERRTGIAVLVNTSFNVRGEPIVCTPHDAYRCFLRTEMDYLAIGDFLLDRREQPARAIAAARAATFAED